MLDPLGLIYRVERVQGTAEPNGNKNSTWNGN